MHTTQSENILTNPIHSPHIEEVSEIVGRPLFNTLCSEILARYNGKAELSFSKCSMGYGWNIKFKKGSKSLCTIYPHEGSFSLMIVIGRKQKEAAQSLLPSLHPVLEQIYDQTPCGNDQRWMWIDLEDQDELADDLMKLIDLRLMK